jgi:pimeloyl-ACP methyl ester carboxylesterase
MATMAPTIPARVVTLEGYGVSALPSARLDPAALALRLLTGLPERPVVLAGHSASCQVVAHAARLAPDRVAGLFLVGPTTDPRAQGWPRLLGRWMANACHERPGQVPTLLRQYARTRPATMLRAMEAARHDRIDLALAEVTCPVRVVRGRHDRLCPRSWAESVGPTVTVEAGAHMVPLTHGELVAAQLVQFLATDR